MDKNINEASLAQFDAIEFVPAQGIAIPEYLSRHFIPADQSLWHLENYERFLIERRKLLKARIQRVFSFDDDKRQ